MGRRKMTGMKTYLVIGRGASKSLQDEALRPQRGRRQVALLVLPVPDRQGQEGNGRDCVRARGAREEEQHGEELRSVPRYDPRSGTHNMYKEFRDVTLNGAIDQMYQDMAGRHRTRKRSVYVVKAEAISAGQCKRKNVKVFHDNDIKFPLPHSAQQRTHKRYKSLYAVSKPVTNVQ